MAAQPSVPRGQAKKLYRPWTGPFRIVCKLSDAVYRVQHTQARRKRLVVHFDRLKPCPPDVRIPDAATRTRSRTTTPPIGTNLELLDWDPLEAPPRRYPRREHSVPDRYQAGVLYSLIRDEFLQGGERCNSDYVLRNML